MGGWIDGVYRQINKRYQKILFHIRSAYFANDLLTLTLQLLRDGICYGFLIYRLAHGTMTVSGFVLMLGAVSGFSSYFNEITSSLSKSVLCLEQIRWMREFLDLPLPAGHMLLFRPEFTEEKPLEICFSHVSFSYPESEKKILGEPTATLDPIAEAEIYEQFSQMISGKTAVYISHRMSSCKFCDRIVVLDHGRIAEDGTHDTLLAKHGIYTSLYETQAQYYTTPANA